MSGGFTDHFGSVAGAYAHYRPTYPAPLFAWLAGMTPARQRAWDCATGTGQAAIGLAAHFTEVVATDASASQLAAARPHPGVHYRLAEAENSGLEADSLDLVTVAQAAHWFDRPRFFSEVERVLRPGGVLAVWSYGIPELEGEGPDALLQHFYADIVGPYWPPRRRWWRAATATWCCPSRAWRPRPSPWKPPGPWSSCSATAPAGRPAPAIGPPWATIPWSGYVRPWRPPGGDGAGAAHPLAPDPQGFTPGPGSG